MNNITPTLTPLDKLIISLHEMRADVLSKTEFDPELHEALMITVDAHIKHVMQFKDYEKKVLLLTFACGKISTLNTEQFFDQAFIKNKW